MIPGAISPQQFEQHPDQYREHKVIAYCTVGARSDRFAKKLNAAGFTALNFKESIVGWCEASYPLVTPAGKPTKSVHTYSAKYKVPSSYQAVY